MFHYSPSSRSSDYTSYLPGRSYRPASFGLYDAPSTSFPFEDQGYPSSPHSFLPPRTDAETRYRRALYELEAAEQEYEAHIALERARQAAAVRQRAAAEAARVKREDALYAEIERAKRARGLQLQVEDILAQRQRGLRAPTAFERAHRGGHALLHALVSDDAEGASIPDFFEGRPSRSRPTPLPTRHEPVDRTHRDGRALLRALVSDDTEGVSIAGLFEGRPGRSQPTPPPAQGAHHEPLDRTHRDGHALLCALVSDDGEGVSLPHFFEGRRTRCQPTPSPTHPDPLDRAHRDGRAFLRALVTDDAEGVSIPPFSESRPGQASGSSTHHENGALTFGDLLGLFAGVRGHPEPEAAGQPQRPASAAAPQPQHPTEAQTQSHSPKHEDAEVNLSNILDFFRSIAVQAQSASGEQPAHERGTTSQAEGADADGKGKGKAKAEPEPERSLYERLRERVNGARDQEMRDLEHAIKLSLQDRDVTDVKKAQASKGSRSSSGASSSRVRIEEPLSSGRAASPSVNAIPERVSPLTAIRAVRTQFSALESGFKFPSVLDFVHSELAVSSKSAPVRAYEQALTGLLERLDAIESDGDEEVRDVRREVVREVERALEDVERKVKEQAPQVPVPEAAKEESSRRDIESEVAKPNTSITPDAAPALIDIAEEAKPTQLSVASVVSQADVDIDVAISGEYETGSADAESSKAAVAEVDGAAPAAPAKGEASIHSAADLEAVPASEDVSDSIATITPAVPAPRPLNKSASSPPAAEAFLTSMSHDQYTFPPRPAFSQSNTGPGVAHDDDAILVDRSSEGGSVRGVEEEWTEFDA